MKNDDIVNVLYGCKAYYGNCAAWCKYHHCHLTIKQIKQKQCLRKQCVYLDKLEHPYWRKREEIKLKKKGG